MAEDNTGLTTGLTYECGSIKIANNFDVSVTRPLDIRLVVKNVESLYDTEVMKSPYKGMLVNIEGTSDVYVYTGAYKDKKGIFSKKKNILILTLKISEMLWRNNFITLPLVYLGMSEIHQRYMFL